MGTFNVDVEIGNLTGAEFLTINALVDTASTHTTVPASLLSRLGIRPRSRRRFELADGRVVEYRTGYALVRYGGDDAIVQVVFGSDEISPNIGATTLENLNLAVDLVGHRLIPVNNLMR